MAFLRAVFPSEAARVPPTAPISPYQKPGLYGAALTSARFPPHYRKLTRRFPLRFLTFSPV